MDVLAIVSLVTAVSAAVIAILSHIKRSRCCGGCLSIETIYNNNNNTD